MIFRVFAVFTLIILLVWNSVWGDYYFVENSVCFDHVECNQDEYCDGRFSNSRNEFGSRMGYCVQRPAEKFCFVHSDCLDLHGEKGLVCEFDDADAVEGRCVPETEEVIELGGWDVDGKEEELIDDFMDVVDSSDEEFGNFTESLQNGTSIRRCGTHRDIEDEWTRFFETPASMVDPFDPKVVYDVPSCGYGLCDNVNFREKYFGTIQQNRIVYLHFHVMQGHHPRVSQARSLLQHTLRRLNQHFSQTRIQFKSRSSGYHGKFRNHRLCREADLTECRRRFGQNCVLDYQVIEDIYGKNWRRQGVVHILIGQMHDDTLLGFSHFPWNKLHGLLTIAINELGPTQSTTAHELGHTLGLYHTFRGRTEDHVCNQCAERQPSPHTGDMCEVNYHCREPNIREHRDPCDPGRRFWHGTQFQNIMSYAPSECQTIFTPKQVSRMHCWIAMFPNVFHELTEPELRQFQQTRRRECFTNPSGIDYRGSFSDFGRCKQWPRQWHNSNLGIEHGVRACRNPNPNINPSLWCFHGDDGTLPTLCSESGYIHFLNSTCF